jgi:L-lactate dehydrogenase (cytochrome)
MVSSIHSGFDVERMLAQEADGVLLGGTCIYALVEPRENDVGNLLDLIVSEMLVAMTLTGAWLIVDISCEASVFRPRSEWAKIMRNAMIFGQQ